jgi:hypothetical protein
VNLFSVFSTIGLWHCILLRFRSHFVMPHVQYPLTTQLHVGRAHVFMHNTLLTLFFLENVGELRFIPLSRRKRDKSPQHNNTTHTHKATHTHNTPGDDQNSHDMTPCQNGTGSPAIRPSVIRPLPCRPVGTHGPHASNPGQSVVRQANPALPECPQLGGYQSDLSACP